MAILCRKLPELLGCHDLSLRIQLGSLEPLRSKKKKEPKAAPAKQGNKRLSTACGGAGVFCREEEKMKGQI